MAIQIQFRRGTASEWTSANPVLALAEMGIETDTDLFKIGDGVQQWNSLDYGGIRGYTGSRGAIGYTGSSASQVATNVLYVAKNGNDSYPGTSISFAKLTIKAALTIATRGTTIFVKSGNYTEINPMTVPDFVSIVGDGLRAVTVSPYTITSDLFYVNNGCYLTGMTFKGHESPSAVVAFNPDGSAGVISTSPYVQNCTSLTGTGTGMRVDGNHALGLKSMVVDAFTQYNQGGIGIHMLNGGNMEIVSVFTICCDVAFLAESGAFCSINNSNSSFGNVALKANGVSNSLYTGKVSGSTTGRIFTIDGLTKKPNIGDAVSFGDGSYYTISSSTAIKVGATDVVYPTLDLESATYRNARQTILDEKSKLQVKVIIYILETFPGFDFNQFKCSRDVGLLIDAVSYDMVLNTNYQTIQAATSYYRADASVVINSQLTQHIAVFTYLKSQVLSLFAAGVTYNRLSTLFDILINVIQNGVNVAPAISYTSPTGATTSTTNAGLILQNNKEFIKEQTVAYINSFTYSTSTCFRDVGLIVDSLAFDLLVGGTSQSTFAGLQYWNKSGYTGQISNQLTTTTNAIAYVQTLVANTASNTTATSIINTNFNTLLSILNSGTGSVSSLIIPNSTASTNTYIVSAYNAIISAKTSIQTQAISWITTNHPTFVYSTTTCFRDIGYIIDSAAFDLLYGGNRQSVQSATYYYGFSSTSSSITNEIPQTTAAYNFIRLLAANVVKNILPTSYYQLSNTVTQITSVSTATYLEVQSIQDSIDLITAIISNGPGSAPALVPIGLTASTASTVVSSFNSLLINKDFIQKETIAFINKSFINVAFTATTCKRDIGLIIDAVTYDIIYGGNSQTADAADTYYDGAVLRIPSYTKPVTVAAYSYIKTIIDDCLLNIVVTPRQTVAVQNTSVAASSSATSVLAQSLINIVTNIVENGYSSTVYFEERNKNVMADDTAVTFHQYSLITSSGHTFEWIGAGTNINSALPYLGGVPISANNVVEVNGGKVFYTGTDERGDFRIGNDLVINRNVGTISGRTFTKSLFAIMTPYILAIG